MSTNNSHQAVNVPNFLDGNAWNFKDDIVRLEAFLVIALAMVLVICFIAWRYFKMCEAKYLHDRKARALETRANYRIRLKEIEHLKSDEIHSRSRRPE
jgi:hypothetical protein